MREKSLKSLKNEDNLKKFSEREREFFREFIKVKEHGKFKRFIKFKESQGI